MGEEKFARTSYKASESCILTACQLFLWPCRNEFARQFLLYSHGIVSAKSKSLQTILVSCAFYLKFNPFFAVASMHVHVCCHIRGA